MNREVHDLILWALTAADIASRNHWFQANRVYSVITHEKLDQHIASCFLTTNNAASRQWDNRRGR